MSDAKQENKCDSIEQAVNADFSELGVVNSSSNLKCIESVVAEKQVKDSVPYKDYKIVAEKDSELIKEHENLQKHLIEHNQLKLKNISETVTENSVFRDRTREVVDIFRKTKYTGNLGPLSFRLPQLSITPNEMIPPEPRVKRLKGEFAKSVANKNDDCNWFMFHPDLNIVKPNPKINTRIQK